MRRFAVAGPPNVACPLVMSTLTFIGVHAGGMAAPLSAGGDSAAGAHPRQLQTTLSPSPSPPCEYYFDVAGANDTFDSTAGEWVGASLSSCGSGALGGLFDLGEGLNVRDGPASDEEIPCACGLSTCSAFSSRAPRTSPTHSNRKGMAPCRMHSTCSWGSAR
jgi:hypothetical protein